MSKNDTVTFETLFVPSKETPKAYCVLGGQWLPKSLTRIERVIEQREVARFRHQPKKGTIFCVLVEITVPKWVLRG